MARRTVLRSGNLHSRIGSGLKPPFDGFRCMVDRFVPSLPMSHASPQIGNFRDPQAVFVRPEQIDMVLGFSHSSICKSYCSTNSSPTSLAVSIQPSPLQCLRRVWVRRQSPRSTHPKRGLNRPNDCKNEETRQVWRLKLNRPAARPFHVDLQIRNLW